MGKLSAKLVRTERGIAHWCPACKCFHAFTLYPLRAAHTQWLFNNNLVEPSFQPDNRIRIEDEKEGDYVCHYRLHEGRIEYLEDCTHAMRGKNIMLPDIPPGQHFEEKGW